MMTRLFAFVLLLLAASAACLHCASAVPAQCGLPLRDCVGPVSETWAVSWNCSGPASYNTEVYSAVQTANGPNSCVNSTGTTSMKYYCNGLGDLVTDTFHELDCVGPSVKRILSTNQCFSQTTVDNFTASFIYRCDASNVGNVFVPAQTRGPPLTDHHLPITGNATCFSPNNCTAGTPYVTHFTGSSTCASAPNASYSEEVYSDLRLDTCYNDSNNNNVEFKCYGGTFYSVHYTRGCVGTPIYRMERPINQCFVSRIDISSSEMYHCNEPQSNQPSGSPSFASPLSSSLFSLIVIGMIVVLAVAI